MLSVGLGMMLVLPDLSLGLVCFQSAEVQVPSDFGQLNSGQLEFISRVFGHRYNEVGSGSGSDRSGETF